MIVDDVRATLAEATIDWESERASREAIDAAVELDQQAIAEGALGHKFAKVVETSLQYLAAPLAAPLPARFLELVQSDGSGVRHTLARLLTEKPHADHVPTLMELARDEWSPSAHYHDEDASFPIARQALEGLALSGPLLETDLGGLDAISIATSDPRLRQAIFKLLVLTGEAQWQSILFDRARDPGRGMVRRDAAYALAFEYHYVLPAIVSQIDLPILSTKIPSVAVPLAVVAALRAEEEVVLNLARQIAANPKRRVLALVMAWITQNERGELSRKIGALLPQGHPALEWIRSGPAERAGDDLIADLGEPHVCAEVLTWVNPAKAEK